MKVSAMCMIGILSSVEYKAVSVKAILPVGLTLKGKFPSQSISKDTALIIITEQWPYRRYYC